MSYLHELDDDVVVLRRPVGELYARAAAVGVLAPASLLGLYWTLVFVAAPSTLLWVAGAAFAALTAAGLAVVGAWLALSAPRRASRDLVRLDLAERLLERAGRPAEVLKSPDAVVLRSHGLGWRLELVRDDTGVVLVRGPRGAARGLVEAAEALAEALESEARVAPAARRAARPGPPAERTWAALIWSPLDPINLVAALAALALAKEPWLRRTAKHAAVQLVLEGALLTFGAIGLLGLVLVASPSRLGLLLFLAPLALVLATRIGVRSYVAWRARDGEAWPAPWVGWLLARPTRPAPRPAPRPAATAAPAPAFVTPPQHVRASPKTQVGQPW